MDPIDRLLAMEEIRQLKARYFRLVDTKQWDAFRALFTAEASIYYPESMSEPATIDATMPLITSSLQHAISIHHGHMAEIDMLDADHATAIWSMEDQVYCPADEAAGVPPRTIIGAGHYHEDYVREAGGWRIAGLKLTRLRLQIQQVLQVPA